MQETYKIGQSKLMNYMWYTSKSLSLVGLWPVNSNGSTKDESGLMGILNFFYFAVIAFGLIVQVFQMLTNCWINYTKFESAAESIGPMMALITSFGKMCIYRRNRLRLSRLVISLNDCIKEDNADVLKNLEDYTNVGSIACGSLLSVTWFLTVGYLSAPLTDTSERNLPFASWYPFNYANSTILYALAYGHECALTFFGCCTMSTEITFVLSVFHCCARLKVLQTNLKSLSNEKNVTDNEFSKKINFELRSLVKFHCDILRDVEDINYAYTYIVMVLFFAAVIAICCAGLQITSDSTESTTWTILFLVLAMYYAEQLLFYYLPGEILVAEAMAVSFAAYSSGWEMLEINHRKTIHLMIQRSHKPPRLLVGHLSPLRLENYSAFLTTTASYFTSIRAVAES